MSKQQKDASVYGQCLVDLCDCFLQRKRITQALLTLEKELPECLKSEFAPEAIRLTELICDIRNFEQRDNMDTVDLARSVYDSLRMRYGESSTAALDGLQLCHYCASKTDDKTLADAYSRECTVLRNVRQRAQLARLAYAQNAPADRILALGDCLMTLQDLTGAATVLRDGLKRYPANKQMKQRVADITATISSERLANLGFSEEMKQRQYRLTKKETTALSRRTTERQVIDLNNRGVRALNTARYNLAIDYFIQASRVDPDYNLAKSNLAIALNNKALNLSTTPKEAIRYCEQALFLDPQNKTTDANLCGLIRLMGFDPKNFDNRVVLAENALERKELAGALIEYTAALAIKDDDGIREKLDSFPKPGDYAYLFFNPKFNWDFVPQWNMCRSWQQSALGTWWSPCIEAHKF
ncbi:MAG: hypothetical protein K2X93_13540 [Candidatus Obscuribacterales bacterium]|nr:hypothetical protein [Candidatus Obscuribacterales bacterium]